MAEPVRVDVAHVRAPAELGKHVLLRQLREQGLLDADGPRFSASRDVRYSLGLDN